MVPAAIAVIARARFERVHHEAVAGAGGEHARFMAARAAGGNVGHLVCQKMLAGVYLGRVREEEKGWEGGGPGPRCWVGCGVGFGSWLLLLLLLLLIVGLRGKLMGSFSRRVLRMRGFEMDGESPALVWKALVWKVHDMRIESVLVMSSKRVSLGQPLVESPNPKMPRRCQEFANSVRKYEKWTNRLPRLNARL